MKRMAIVLKQCDYYIEDATQFLNYQYNASQHQEPEFVYRRLNCPSCDTSAAHLAHTMHKLHDSIVLNSCQISHQVSSNRSANDLQLKCNWYLVSHSEWHLWLENASN